MANLIQTVLGAISPDTTARLSALLGEPPAATGKGLAAAVPALFAGALQQSTTSAGAGDLLGLVDQATTDGDPLSRADSALADPANEAPGQAMAAGLLGSRATGVAGALASFAGISGISANKLLAMAAPLVLGALAKALGPDRTAGNLSSVLTGERSAILGALPPQLGSMFGLAGAAVPPAAAAAAAPVRPNSFGRWLPWIVGALLLIAFFLGIRSCRREAAPPAPASAPPQAAAPQVPTPPAARPMVSLTLPGGGSLNLPEGSIGVGVARFLASPEPAPRTFVFDNLNYDTASNALTADSQPTIVALTTILKAYPNVQARVVGYTDNQGDPAANKRLSEARAATVKQALVAGGIDGERIATAGMGEEQPLADNATEEGRAQNRRTELEIVKK